MKKLLPLLIAVICLCGCNDLKDINNLGFLVALGIDGDSYTLQFANPASFTGKDAKIDKDSLKTFTVTGKSLESAFNTVEENLLKKVDTTYLKFIVFSDKCDGNLLIKTTDSMMKSGRFHPDTFIAVSLCPPEEYLTGLSKSLEINPSKYFDNIFNGEYNQFSPASTLKTIQDKKIAISVVDNKENGVGFIVLKNNGEKYFCEKSYGETYNILTGNINKFKLITDDGVCMELLLPSVITPEINGDKVYYNLLLKGEIIENVNNVESGIVSKHSLKILENNFKSFLDYNYNQKKTDILDIKKYYKKYFLTNKQYEKFVNNFKEEKLNFIVNVDIDITRDGVLLNED